MVVNASLKRVKRRVTADLHDFFTFPSSDVYGDDVGGGNFRSNIRDFLTRHALMPPPSSLFPHLLTWQILLRVGDLTEGSDASPVVVGLDVIEEDVSRSRSVYCDQCRVVGWSGHPVCTRRYHIIVKSDGGSIGGHVKPCLKCGDEVHLSEPRCKSCNYQMTADDVEDWMYQQLEDTTHLLHGVIHANGYGHLLRINGREGGSRFISGNHIMDFWDRLCKYLGVRKISVMDVSKKYGMEYRLLHAISKGHSWYGEWGYDFGAGSFALTLESYQEAVETLSTLPLSIFIYQGRTPRCHLQDLLLFYQSLAEHELVTIRDLFDFMLSLVHDAPQTISPLVYQEESPKKRRLSVVSNTVLCAWTSGDIERVEEAMMRILMAVTGSNWVSWRSLKRAVCKMGPPELLDYCLKELAGKQATDGFYVHARHNPECGTVEFRVDSGDPSLKGSAESANPFASKSPSREHLIRDLRFFYETLLYPQSMAPFVPDSRREMAIQAAVKLLDCKQFMKDYKPESTCVSDPSMIYLLCQVEVHDLSERELISPPPEPVLLSHNATIADLKSEASKVFQEVYIMLRGFIAEELVEYHGVDDSTLVKLLLNSYQMVLIRGRCPMKHGLGRYRMERGLERWTVECRCGARDDDGERMMACDVCGVWQHTRCAGILDFESVPARFLCERCRGVKELKAGSGGGKCKDEVAVAAAVLGVTGSGGSGIARGGGGGKSVPRCFLGANFCA